MLLAALRMLAAWPFMMLGARLTQCGQAIAGVKPVARFGIGCHYLRGYGVVTDEAGIRWADTLAEAFTKLRYHMQDAEHRAHIEEARGTFGRDKDTFHI